MDYVTLTSPKGTPGSIADYVNYAPLATAAPELIKNAQDELFGRLRVREMRKSLTLNLNQGDISAPLPADYLDTYALFAPYGVKIKRVSDDRLLAMRMVDATGAPLQGYPSYGGIFDGAFQFDVGACTGMAIVGIYYGALYIADAVGTAGQPGYVAPVLTNFLTSRYTHLFRAMLLKHAYAYRKDWDAATKYAQQVEATLEEVEAGDDLSFRDLDDADMGLRL